MVPAKIAWLHGLGFRNGVSGLRAIDRVSNVLPDLLLLEFAKFCQRGHPLRTPTMSRKMVCKMRSEWERYQPTPFHLLSGSEYLTISNSPSS